MSKEKRRKVLTIKIKRNFFFFVIRYMLKIVVLKNVPLLNLQQTKF